MKPKFFPMSFTQGALSSVGEKIVPAAEMCRNLIFHVIKQGVVLRTPLHLEARDVTPSPSIFSFPRR